MKCSRRCLLTIRGEIHCLFSTMLMCVSVIWSVFCLIEEPPGRQHPKCFTFDQMPKTLQPSPLHALMPSPLPITIPSILAMKHCLTCWAFYVLLVFTTLVQALR